MTDLSKLANDMAREADSHTDKNERWIDICALKDLPYDAGAAALLYEGTAKETQLALFRLSDSNQVYAISNFDPFSAANVLARGIICSLGDELAVASPVHKEHFSLTTGKCFEDDAIAVATYPSKILQERVFVHPGPVVLGEQA